jgi:stage II sporulation protein GA (sporulation sigma-E factor processing peptidase)
VQKIYIELVFIDNFIINLLILLLASQLTKSKKRWGRFVLSASVGGAYACAVFGTSGSMVSLPSKLLVSAVMCFTAYYARGERGFWKNACAFYITTFAFAGAIYAVSFCFGLPAASGGSFVIRPQATYIVAGLGAGAVLTALFARVRRRTIGREQWTVDIGLGYSGRHTAEKAYVDTGNMLTEPLSGLSVVLITESAARKLFGKAAFDIMHTSKSLTTFWGPRINCRTGAVSDRLRIVPCATALGQSVLYGLEIDSIALKGQNKGVKAVVCIAKSTLAYGCDAVIGSGLMDELTKGAGYDKVSRTEDRRMDIGAAEDCGERRLHQRKRGAAASTDAAGGSVAADTAGQGR